MVAGAGVPLKASSLPCAKPDAGLAAGPWLGLPSNYLCRASLCVWPGLS